MFYLKEFLDYLLHERRYSLHTLDAYKKDLEQFFEIMNFSNENELVDLKHKSMRFYLVSLVELNLENSTINRKISSVKTFFKYLKQQGVIESNPASRLQSLKKKKNLPQFVPESQLWSKEIFEENEEPFDQVLHELILELFYQTGIRLTELIHLEKKNVTKNQIKVLGKRNKERIIPISNGLFSLVLKFEDLKKSVEVDSKLLIISKSGKKLTPKFVYSLVNHYLGKATNLKKKSPHVLRHTFATHMLNNGASLESIKKLLGHTDLTSTQVYTHNSFKQIKVIYEQAHPRGATSNKEGKKNGGN